MTTHKNTIETGIEINGTAYDLIWEAEQFQNTAYRAYLEESAEPEDRERKVIDVGSFNDDQYDGDCAEFYYGAGKFGDPGNDTGLVDVFGFARRSAKIDAENIVDNWNWPGEVPVASIERIKEDLEAALYDRIGGPYGIVAVYAAGGQKEEAEKTEALIDLCRDRCGYRWRISVDKENNAECWWDNGGRELWEKVTGSKNAESKDFELLPAMLFLRSAAKIPGFFGGPEHAPNPVVINPADEGEDE